MSPLYFVPAPGTFDATVDNPNPHGIRRQYVADLAPYSRRVLRALRVTMPVLDVNAMPTLEFDLVIVDHDGLIVRVVEFDVAACSLGLRDALMPIVDTEIRPDDELFAGVRRPAATLAYPSAVSIDLVLAPIESTR